VAQSIDPKANLDTRPRPQDDKGTSTPRDERLRGGTQGGEAARAMSGVAGEGTPDLSAPSGGVHSATPARYEPRTDVAGGDHTLTGGKSPDEVRCYLGALSFPVRKEDLIRTAASNGAPNDIVRSLSSLPATNYGSFEEVIRDYPRLPEPEDMEGRDNGAART
jgi:hypothetical protein